MKNKILALNADGNLIEINIRSIRQRHEFGVPAEADVVVSINDVDEVITITFDNTKAVYEKRLIEALKYLKKHPEQSEIADEVGESSYNNMLDAAIRALQNRET